MTKSEFYAYIGGLIILTQIIYAKCGIQLCILYIATFGQRCFKSITRFIRFDNEQIRIKRLKNEKTASVSDIWSVINKNLQMTIDERLYPYQGTEI